MSDSETAAEAADKAHLELRVTEVAGYLRTEAAKSGGDVKALGKAFAKRLTDLL